MVTKEKIKKLIDWEGIKSYVEPYGGVPSLVLDELPVDRVLVGDALGGFRASNPKKRSTSRFVIDKKPPTTIIALNNRDDCFFFFTPNEREVRILQRHLNDIRGRYMLILNRGTGGFNLYGGTKCQLQTVDDKLIVKNYSSLADSTLPFLPAADTN